MTAPIMDINAVIKEAAAAAIPAPQPEAKETAEESAEDTSGDDSADESDAVESDVVAEGGDDASDAGASEAAVDLPEGYVAVPSVTEGLATEFVLKDKDGEVEVPDLIVEYKANGKVRQDRLDQVVKMAQWGVYNQDKMQQVESQAQQLAELVQQREAQIERLLQDDDFLFSVRSAYEEENSPESSANRAEQQVQNLRIQHEMQNIQAFGEQFHDGEIVPAIRMITDALPTITPAELETKVMMALQAHVERAPNGQPYVPSSRYDAIRQYIVDDLATWAQVQHARRSQQAVSPTEKKAVAELERARVEAQKAKRAMGQTLKPVGKAGQDIAKPRSAKPATVDDAVSSALDSVLSSIR